MCLPFPLHIPGKCMAPIHPLAQVMCKCHMWHFPTIFQLLHSAKHIFGLALSRSLLNKNMLAICRYNILKQMYCTVQDLKQISVCKLKASNGYSKGNTHASAVSSSCPIFNTPITYSGYMCKFVLNFNAQLAF